MRSLGIDTSNYTCSAAIYEEETGKVWQVKIPLPVKEGEIGLRQSQALFEHVVKMGEALEELFKKTAPSFDSIGVSSKPRQKEGSYMPCFLAGVMAAKSISVAAGKPLSCFSHQEGHIAAALVGANAQSLLERKEEFFAFHISGGTTDCLLVAPSESGLFSIKPISTSLDLKAGQVIDRIGASLGLKFPSGRHLEKLALNVSFDECKNELKHLHKSAPVKEGNCSLSGLENICKRLQQQNIPESMIARYIFLYLQNTIEKMLLFAFKKFGEKPVLFSGGVSSNLFLKDYFSHKHSGFFAPTEYSSDNAVGVAFLSCLKERFHAEI